VSGKKVSSDGTDDRINFIVACVELQTFVMAYMEKTLKLTGQCMQLNTLSVRDLGFDSRSHKLMK
jgi:hypothetical protein